MKLSLRVRTIIPIALTIVIFGLFAVGSISWFARDNLLDGAQKDLELIVHEKSREIGRLFDTSQKLAKTLSQNSFLISYLENDEEIIYQDEHILEHFEQGNIGGQYSAIYVMGVDGVTYVSTDEAFVGNNYGFRPYFKGAVQGESVVSVARGVTSGKLGYYFSHPVYSQDDIIGVVVAKLNPDLVQDYISFGELGDGFHVMFTDQYGVVVYSDISERLFRSVGALDKDVITFIKDERTYEGVEIRPLQYDDVQDVIRAGSGVATIWIYDEMDAKDELLVVDYVEGYPFYLIVEQDVETFVRPINQMIYILIFFVSIAVLASVVLVSLIVNRFLRSIKKLQGAALRVSEGDFSLRLDDISSYNEINDVGLAFNMMIDQVKKSRKEIEQKVEKQTQSLVKNKTDLENQQKAILNILEDVEEEKAGSTRLAGELEKFRLAVDNASDHIVITDLDGIVIHANKAVERITGYSLDSIIGQKAGKLWGGLMGKPFYDKLWKTIKKDKKIFTGEIKNRRKGGEEYVAEVSISPVLDSKKNVQFFLGIERDISERKEAEDQVRKVLNDMQEQAQVLAGEKAKDEALLENIGDGIISTNQDGVVTMVNNAALEMLKYDEKDVIEKSVMDVINIVDEKDKPINMAHHPMVLALSTGEKTTTPLGTTYYYVRKDGTKFAAGITVTPFVWQGKIVGTILVFRDITVEKEIDQMKTEFVSLASHQLRTPLSTINWYAEMLLSGDAGKITKDQKEYLQEIYTGNQRMVELVNSLLNVSRIELGTFAVDPEPTDMKEMAESVFGELKPQIAEKGIQITKKYDKKIGKISLDTKLMRIVFQNLLTNAVKYTGEKGEIGLEIKRRAKDIMVTVSDNGFGIPKKQQAQIFTKMFRADNVKAKDTTGTGLGLYIIKSIIEQSASGKIWFESQENKGTTFYFTIPLTGMVKKEGSKALT